MATLLGPVVEYEHQWRWRGPGELGFRLEKPPEGYEQYHIFIFDFLPPCCDGPQASLQAEVVETHGYRQRSVTICTACNEAVREGEDLPTVILTPSIVEANAAWGHKMKSGALAHLDRNEAYLSAWLEETHPLESHVLAEPLLQELDSRFTQLLGPTVERYARSLAPLSLASN